LHRLAPPDDEHAPERSCGAPEAREAGFGDAGFGLGIARLGMGDQCSGKRGIPKTFFAAIALPALLTAIHEAASTRIGDRAKCPTRV
jgi:hypothetical protein